MSRINDSHPHLHLREEEQPDSSDEEDGREDNKIRKAMSEVVDHDRIQSVSNVLVNGILN